MEIKQWFSQTKLIMLWMHLLHLKKYFDEKFPSHLDILKGFLLTT